jgi:hypothetical protein
MVGKSQGAVQQLLRAFPQWLLAFLSKRVYNPLYYKLKEHRKTLKTLSGSSPDTDLSDNITLSQSESHATVLLIAIPAPIGYNHVISVHFPWSSVLTILNFENGRHTGKF